MTIMGSVLVRQRLKDFLDGRAGPVFSTVKKLLPDEPAAKIVFPSSSVIHGEVKDTGARDVIEGDGEPEGGRFGKRKKFAVLLSYCGKGYLGMQKNPGCPTIEEDLLAAMCKALAFPPNMENDLVKIRVMAVKRVTKGFDSRSACGGRMYEYLMPTYAFAPYHLSTADYRMPDATVEQVDRLLQCYVGTHNYHNFTKGKKYHDTSSNRYILSFKTSGRFVASNLADMNSKRIEFISLRVRGQSFMVHQIRKMIGLVIAVVCGRLKEEEFAAAFEEDKFDIPRAPSLGLLLDNVYFEWYNRRYCSDGERKRLDWQDLHSQIEEFKRKHIYRSIVETEIKEMPMMQWLCRLQDHSFYASRDDTTTARQTLIASPHTAQFVKHVTVNHATSASQS